MEFLVGCGSSVAADAGNSFLAKIKKHCGYLFSYNNNMKGLEDARVNLEAKRSDAIRLVDDASTKSRDVSSVVSHWRSEAEKLNKEAQAIIFEKDRRSSLCLNPWTRYSSSKNAWELTQMINEKVRNAPDFGTTFDRPPPDSGAKFNLGDSMDFISRQRILNKVLEALKDEEVSMCSICGMGGVGKTTLAKKLILRVERYHLFDKVVMVTVSQNPNFEKLQNEIIELLGLKIDESTMPARANKLNAWLTNNKILLILDDVWWMLSKEDFENIGIPSVSKGCKIVLTSRNEDECKKMGSQRNFRVGVLEAGEAWNLFRKMAGNRTEDSSLHETARNITTECGGLPIAIVTIANALKYKPQGTWYDSLTKLRNSNLSSISDMEKVYSRIQLSYDLLNDKESQSCFRLCCLYPEDHNIPIEDLVLYGLSLDMFESVDTVKEARDRVESIIHTLKTSFLLLDGEKYECVKMHDIVRDFAVSISSKAEDPYIVKCDNIVATKWPDTAKYKNCRAISLICGQMQEHPVDLECPKLELLQLAFGDGSKPLHAGIFEGMKDLKVLSLKVSILLQSVGVPKNLRALFITETTNPQEPIGDLINDHLQFFSFHSKRVFDDFPMEIGLLCNLRFIRFSDVKFYYIPPGVLSKLTRLEELYLPWRFMNWGCKEYRNRMNANLDEIESLPLTALEIAVRKGSFLGEKVANNLARFLVYVGTNIVSVRNDYRRGNMSKTLFEAVGVDASDIKASWISTLLKKTESLYLIQVRDLKNINLQLENNGGFEQLKEIDISICEEMEYLVDIEDDQQILWFPQLECLTLRWLHNMKEICRFHPNFSKIEAPLLFRNLIEINIDYCDDLRSVFPVSLARTLSQVQKIKITWCNQMEKIFYADELDDDGDGDNHQMEENKDGIIILPQLKFLKLGFMGKLRVFYEGNHGIELPSLQSLKINRCKKMEDFSYRTCNAPLLQRILVNEMPHGFRKEEDVNANLKKMLKLH